MKRRKKHQNYKNLEITFKKTGKKKSVKLISESQSKKSLKVIFDDGKTGWVQKNTLKNISEL